MAFGNVLMDLDEFKVVKLRKQYYDSDVGYLFGQNIIGFMGHFRLHEDCKSTKFIGTKNH
jgi:hypothetical protein